MNGNDDSIEVILVRNRYSLHLGDFGIELRFIEACEIRRSLASILNGEPYFSVAPEDKSIRITFNTYIQDDGDIIQFAVGHCFWSLHRIESRKLLDALDAALM